ncbi:hypothetical protein KVT40_006411 [Elsinoe batatas]|uniref:Uncharacterized protein n=1 Tax=Elsinoe batatas TaxID=2601811 RepID=A0A8K0PBP2_9PEZI|nr:hypothetical protein KVT40_006411 [Elsinoe batatas]
MMVDNPEISDDEIMSSLRAVGPPSRERWSDERIAYLELERLLIRTHPALISSEVSDAEAARIQDEAHAKRIQIFEDFGKATNTLMQTAWEDTVRCDEAHGWRGSDLEQRIAIIISDLNDKLLEARKSCLVQSCSVLPRQKFGRMRLTREATVSFVRSHPCDLEGQYTTSDEAETRDQIDIHRLHDSVGEDDGETSEAADDWIYIDDELLGDTESLDGVLVGADDHTYPDKGYDDSSEIMEDPDEIL